MPVHPCRSGGNSGYMWGSKGKCYTYTSGDKKGAAIAHSKAQAQGRAAYAHGYKGANKSMEIIEKKLPDISPNEDEQTYVSRCIAFETKHSPDRPADQISRMCYEKYRNRSANKSEMDILSESLDKITLSLEELKKFLP